MHRMSELIVSCLALGGAAGVFFLRRTLRDKQIKIFKRQRAVSTWLLQAVAVLLFVLYMPHLFGLEEISNQIGLQGELFSPAGYVGLAVLDWLTTITIALCILAPFFQKKEVKEFCAFFGSLIVLVNVVALKPTVVSILGEADMLHWRTFVYEGVLALTAIICFNLLADILVNKDFSGIGKRIAQAALFGAVYLIAFMPVYLPQLLVGYAGQETKDFTFTHRLLIYATLLIPVAIYFAKRHKSEEERYFLLVLLSLSGVIQYFSFHAHRTGSSVFPLHLCNTAIVCMFFAYAFKIKSLYYFTYFINVLGAFCAIILPDTSSLITRMSNIVYWYNHLYAFFLPLLGVALGIFKRPNLKMMGGSLVVFTIYVVFVFFLNSYLNSPIFGDKYESNYFFLYNDFFIDKFPFARPLKYNYIWNYTAFGTEMKAYPVFVLTIYLVFVALTFAMWGFYTMVFRISDEHRELARRKKMQRVDRLNLLKELNGRPLGSPLYPEGENMVKIKNFSKTYAGSTKKSVDGLNLEIHDGEVFGFIGHNGAGKSTTIKSLVGIQSITEGSIEIEGYDIARQPLEAKLRLGYVSDNHALYEKLTGREYINYVAELYMVNEKDKNERLERFVKMFNLEHAIDNEIKSYSHGMKQKTMVIAALIHNPKVWVLDEPLTGLDPTSAYQIKECMRQHADAGNIVFFSSHVIEVVEKICDRIAIISGGKLCRVNTMDEIKKEGLSLEQLYLQYAKKSGNTEEQVEGGAV